MKNILLSGVLAIGMLSALPQSFAGEEAPKTAAPSSTNSETMGQEVKEGAKKADKDIKRSLKKIKKTVNQEFCDSGEETCTYNKKTGKKSSPNLAPVKEQKPEKTVDPTTAD